MKEAVKFELGRPFKPFEQVIAQLSNGIAHSTTADVGAPCKKRACASRGLRNSYEVRSVHIAVGTHIMTRDPSSPIIDFYPTDFKQDLNGKRHMWQAVVLLPFIDVGSQELL